MQVPATITLYFLQVRQSKSDSLSHYDFDFVTFLARTFFHGWDRDLHRDSPCNIKRVVIATGLAQSKGHLKKEKNLFCFFVEAQPACSIAVMKFGLKFVR